MIFLLNWGRGREIKTPQLRYDIPPQLSVTFSFFYCFFYVNLHFAYAYDQIPRNNPATKQ